MWDRRTDRRTDGRSETNIQLRCAVGIITFATVLLGSPPDPQTLPVGHTVVGSCSATGPA